MSRNESHNHVCNMFVEISMFAMGKMLIFEIHANNQMIDHTKVLFIGKIKGGIKKE